MVNQRMLNRGSSGLSIWVGMSVATFQLKNPEELESDVNSAFLNCRGFSSSVFQNRTGNSTGYCGTTGPLNFEGRPVSFL